MYFESARALLQMDGHGAYVWGVYAAALLIIVTLALTPVVKRRQFIRDEGQRQRREMTVGGKP